MSIAQINDYCIGCGNKLNAKNQTNHCIHCFRKNVNNCRSLYYKKNYEKIKQRPQYWKTNGIKITQEQLDDHYKKEHCDFCGKKFNGKKKNLDHCHDTHEYRGTLCTQCNTSLGKLGDNLDLIIERLKKYKEVRSSYKRDYT